jgi:drug/metabolite transporter (DMT)-like permease
LKRPGTGLLIAVFVLLALIWGTTWAAIRVQLRGVPPFTGVALRFAIASALLFAVAFALKIPLGRTAVERRLWLVNGALSFFASYGIVYWCEQYVPSGLTAVLFATFPLFLTLLAHGTLEGERMTRRTVFGVLVGFAGVATIFSEDFELLGGPQVGFAAVVMLASPIVSAVSNVALKRWGAGFHPISLAAVPMAIAAVAMAPVAWATERNLAMTWDASSIGALVYLAVFGSAVTFTGYYWLMAHIPATRLALIAYLTPVFAVATGALWLDEPLTPKMILGAAFVLAGVGLASRR